jgi:hypothetical protein
LDEDTTEGVDDEMDAVERGVAIEAESIDVDTEGNGSVNGTVEDEPIINRVGIDTGG